MKLPRLLAGLLSGMLPAIPLVCPATLNERLVRQVLYVDSAHPAAADTNTGADPAHPLRSLQRAVDLAQGTATRIRIASGVYREYVQVGPGTNLLVLEAAEPGHVTLSGAEPVGGLRQDANDLWSFAWTNHWGLNGNQFYFPGSRTKLNLRRELVFVGAHRLSQRCQEDERGSALEPARLQPGEFTVDEPQGRIWLRPPAGLVLRTSTPVEAALRGYGAEPYPKDGRSLLTIRDHSNVVLRGLRVERACNYILANPALSISGTGGKDPSSWPAHFLLDRCACDDNNGVGLGLNTLRDVTLVRCSLSRNGERGGGAANLQGLRVEDCDLVGNGWRFGPWLAGHDMAGFKLFDGAESDGWFKARSQRVRFVRCLFRGNLCHNFWQDFGPVDTVLESCLFEESPHTAVMQEITPGPLTLTNCVIRRCGLAGEAALLVVASPDVRLFDTTIYDCGQSRQPAGALLELLADTRTVGPRMENAVKRLRLERCTLQANRPNTYLFRLGCWNGAPSPRSALAATICADQNLYFCAERPLEGLRQYQDGRTAFFQARLFSGPEAWKNDYPDLSLPEWQHTPDNPNGPPDQHSRWEALPFEQLERRNPLGR